MNCRLGYTAATLLACAITLGGCSKSTWSLDPTGMATLLGKSITLASATYSVAYNGNGYTGGSAPSDANIYGGGDTVTVLANTGSLVRTNYDFRGWNTRADSLGIDYIPGSTFILGSSDLTLYAIWTPFFAGGDGTAGNPYQVSMASQLNHVRDYPGAHYIQTADIDLNVAPYNTGNGWDPIGDTTPQFVGTYDGNGYAITSLYINRPAENNVGLFGYSNGAVLRNIVLDAAIVTGYDNVGSLVGYNTSVSLATPSSVGNPLIGNCSSSGVTVTGHNNVGGLVGYNWGSSNPAYASVIENCFATAVSTRREPISAVSWALTCITVPFPSVIPRSA